MKLRLPSNRSSAAAIILAIFGCSGPVDERRDAKVAGHHASGIAHTPFTQIEDNIQHDTLLIQTTFDLGDGTFVMVAGNQEPTFEGIRLYRYKVLADSTPLVLSYSTPGYDSWTMFPTFFPVPKREAQFFVLANFGERESWGQKVLRMDGGFTDLGFMDVAFPERINDGDTAYLRRTSIGPYSRVNFNNDTVVFMFACDSVYLYDDLAGKNDYIVPAFKVRYTHHPSTGLELWFDGQRRAVQQPS